MAPGLYLHVPFCATVCPYCDFAVLVGDAERRERFVQGLIGEIELRQRQATNPTEGLKGEGTPLSPEPGLKGEDAPLSPEPGLKGEDAPLSPEPAFDTVYFGGGTPSMLEPEQLGRILRAARGALELAADPWIFVEANPEDVTPERLRWWAELGVRTLSLGVQSFDRAELGFLGRLHGPKQARRAVELALEAGFATVSLDLIYGLPGQCESAWRSNLEAAVALGPDHLSCYQLTVHPKTAFGVRRRRGELVELPDDEQAELFLLTHRFLNDAGFQGYEVSNFARSPEHRSRHNMKYWDHTPYLGLGPSAHSFAGRRRWWNRRSVGPWQASIAAGELPVEDWEELSDHELALERLMLAMRTYAGVDSAQLARRYGLDLASSVAAETIERMASESLLTVEGSVLRPTLRGLAIADSLARDLAG